jgi:hypothetical protein
MLWEIPALAVLMELRTRAVLRTWAGSSCRCSMPAP